MTPKDFKETLERLDLTQVGCSRLLQINERTVRHYVAGTLEIPTYIVWALRGLEAWGAHAPDGRYTRWHPEAVDKVSQD